MKKQLKLPAHITNRESISLARELSDSYEFDDPAGKNLLVLFAETHQRYRSAASVIDRDGMLVVDRYGKKKLHPLATVERDSRNALLVILRTMNVDSDVVSLPKR